MARQLWLLALVWTASAASLAAQPFRPEASLVYDDTRIPSIYIEIDPADLQAILANVQSDDEYPARFVFDDGTVRDTVENVGVRLRGNTSRDAQKKSFKISFNTFERGRKFYGFEKLNLNGEHNDPSFVRAKLAWDLFGTVAVPASRANHVRLYVNGAYYGLRINVEHIDEQFLQSRFADDGGNLYKCLYPADLNYRSPGTPEVYRPVRSDRRPYDLTQGEDDADGYDDLAHFIRVLNLTPEAGFVEAIEQVFDVNGYLRVLAVDVATGSWDDYWFLMNNYYLYHDPSTGRFHFIPYDYDNTFGVDFGENEDWGRRNVYAWGSLDLNERRPLARRILDVPAYRDRFTFYLRRLLQHAANPDVLVPRIEALHRQISEAIETDPYYPLEYGWDADDFHRSYTEALGGHVYYGLIPFVETRTRTALEQLDAVDVVPILSGLAAHPRVPGADQAVRFTVLVEDEAEPVSVALRYRLADGTAETLPMYDDGAHDDYAAGDGYYGATIPALHRSAALQVDAEATDASGQTGRSAALQLQAGAAGPEIYVNEIMADNDNTVVDEAGQYDDWIELYNATDAAVSLAGYTLTDNLDTPGKWALPDVSIPARGFLLVWADGDTDQGTLHASFSLDKDGEEVGLYDPAGAPVSTFTFATQETDVAYGRPTDGGETLAVLPRATPGASNSGAVGTDPVPDAPRPLTAHVYPNPFRRQATILFDLPQPAQVRVELFDLSGRRVKALPAQPTPAGPGQSVHIDASGLAAGVYVYRLTAEADGGTQVAGGRLVLVR